MPPRGGAQSSRPAVPGAYGFGMETRAAYGGGADPAIYRVTNLNDSGAGSFRAAVEATGPRVVIFEISGTINLASPIRVKSPYLTVAGQTAPSPGITLRGFGVETYTHDVLYQHFRVRPGDIGPYGTGTGMGLEYSPDAYNVVFANLSLSWCNDESFDITSTYGGGARVSLWRVLVAEALMYSSRWSESPGHALGSGRVGDNPPATVSLLQSVFASNAARNPRYFGVRSYTANNLVYNWPEQGALYSNSENNYGAVGTHIGNVYRSGPNTLNSYAVTGVNLPSGSQLYLSDTLIDAPQRTIEEFGLNGGVDPRVGSPPLTLPGYGPVAASNVQEYVLPRAGARPADRDAVDARVIADIVNRTGSIIKSQSAVGGWPVLKVNTRPLTLPTNPHAAAPSGYTNLETWLHIYAAEVEEGTASSSTALPAPPTNIRIVS